MGLPARNQKQVINALFQRLPRPGGQVIHAAGPARLVRSNGAVGVHPAGGQRLHLGRILFGVEIPGDDDRSPAALPDRLDKFRTCPTACVRDFRPRWCARGHIRFHKGAQRVGLPAVDGGVAVGQVGDDQGQIAPGGCRRRPQRQAVLEPTGLRLQLDPARIAEGVAAEDGFPLLEKDRPAVAVGPQVEEIVAGLRRQAVGGVAQLRRPGDLLQEHDVGVPAADLGGDQVQARLQVGKAGKAVQHVEGKKAQGAGLPLRGGGAIGGAAHRAAARSADVEQPADQQQSRRQQRRPPPPGKIGRRPQEIAHRLSALQQDHAPPVQRQDLHRRAIGRRK